MSGRVVWQIARLLVDSKSDIEFTNRKGETCLMAAAQGGHNEVSGNESVSESVIHAFRQTFRHMNARYTY